MTRTGTLRLGEGARCSVLLSMLRPSPAVAAVFPAIMLRQQLEDLVAVRCETRTRNRNTYEAIYFTSTTFPGQEMSCARRFAVVLAEGHLDAFWDNAVVVAPAEASHPTEGNDGEPIDESMFSILGSSSSSRAEDIALVRAQGFEVDDDNEPVEENVPSEPSSQPGGLFPGQRWGWDGIDRRAINMRQLEDALFLNWTPTSESYLNIFLFCLPLYWVKDVLLKETNAAIEADRKTA